MPTTFAYTALSKDGRRTSGTLASDSRASAIAQVVGQGLHPISIQESNGNAARATKAEDASASPVVGKVPNRAAEAFTRELANLLAGGVPLARSLALLGREDSNVHAKALWSQVHDDVAGGTALADALAKWPRSFSSVYVAMVRAGEAGGFLDVVLAQIADFRTREQDLKGKVKAAMVYPIILGILAVGVLIFLLTFFIPRFSNIFQQFGANLPSLTLFIIGASKFVGGWPGLVSAGVAVFGIFFVRAAAQTNT